MNKVNAAEFFRNLEESDEFHVESAKLEFALELKRLMERENLSNSELAERLGVSRPMISKLLRGDANLTIETMVRSARKVGGSLFIRIVRDGVSARLFELARCGEQLRHHEGATAVLRDRRQAALNSWNYAANDNYEIQSIAA